ASQPRRLASSMLIGSGSDEHSTVELCFGCKPLSLSGSGKGEGRSARPARPICTNFVGLNAPGTARATLRWETMNRPFEADPSVAITATRGKAP
ncbi:MAG: hypothetical protein Q7R41_17670, partial [Phycisphaerales bacterium]|nr:hypothetical protein [Phycisphaerales bacterium]